MNSTYCKQCGLSHPLLHVLQSAFLYEENGPIQRVVHALKFGGEAGVVRRMMEYADIPAMPNIPNNEIILVPIPLHKSRLRSRGYNQSEILSKELKRRTGYSVQKLLSRVKNTQAQATLNREMRGTNVKDAFRTIGLVEKEKRYILVDDVCTTGNTLHHAADTLYRAGAVWVGAWVLARAEQNSSIR